MNFVNCLLIYFLLILSILSIAKCEPFRKSDELSNQLKNQFCKNEFTIKFKVISNDKNALFKSEGLYKNLFSIDIELLSIYKGLYNETNNYFTKLYSQNLTKESNGDEPSKEEDNCLIKNTINSLQINQHYVLIGNFNEGRLFLKECDYLKRVDLMRNRDLIMLRNEINCK